jgi:hypothetical protein
VKSILEPRVPRYTADIVRAKVEVTDPEFPRHEGPAPREKSAGRARLSNYCAAA